MKSKVIFCTLALTALLLSGCTQKNSDGKGITTNDAKQIALDQVPGATARDIRGFESDYDDGRLHYDGKIYYEQKEYEFEIDGYTGAILKWDVEPIYSGVS